MRSPPIERVTLTVILDIESDVEVCGNDATILEIRTHEGTPAEPCSIPSGCLRDKTLVAIRRIAIAQHDGKFAGGNHV